MSYFSAEKIGAALAKARVDAGLSQHDMARCIGKGRTTIQSWENGESSPTADKIMDWFEACGRSPLAAMQEMLHPAMYHGEISGKTDEQLDAELSAYLETAPRRVKEMLLFLLLGDHGSYPPAVIAEMCANLHTPLQNRVSVCGQIIDNYNMAQASRTDPAPNAVQPPIEDLEQTYLSGRKAALKGSQAYIAKRVK